MKRAAHILFGCLLFAGCTRVSVEREYESVQREVACRTGHPFYWQRTCGEEACVRSRVAEQVGRPIREEEAVEIALSNNPAFQADLESLAVAKAAVVQAGLITNPFLSIDWRFPKGQSSIESSLVFAATDLWQLPVRKRVACLEQRVVHARVVADALRTATEARHAYYDRQHAIAKLELMGELVLDAKGIQEWAQFRQEFGYTTDLDIAVASSMLGKQMAMELDAERMDKMSNVELRKVLGLDDCYPVVSVEGPLGVRAVVLPDDLVARALECNPEIAALEAEARRAQASVDLARARVLRELNLGVAHVKDPGEPNGFGPAIGVQLPIFDQNQAQIAMAEALQRQACKVLRAKRLEVASEVRKAATRYRTRLRQMILYTNEVLPALERGIDYTETYADRYQINTIMFLESFRALTGARIAVIDLALEVNQTLASLEELLGASL